MAIKVLFNGQEIRKSGYDKAVTTETILAGNPISLVTDSTITKANGASFVVGFALEDTTGLTNVYEDYDNYNRGGKISAVKGSAGELEVNDDGRGSIFDTTQTYTINQALYVGATGLITNQSNGSIIGYVTKVPVTPNDTLKFQLV